MNQIIPLTQNTPEWDDFRKNKIGGSDAPIIMNGLHFNRTQYMLYQEKLDLAHMKQNFAMAEGHRKEELARTLLEKRTGRLFIPVVMVHKSIDWMIASIDAFSIDEAVIGEIKCLGAEDHQNAKDGIIPEKYYAQLQHQMEVAEKDKNLFFSYYTEALENGEIIEDGVIVEVKRDDNYIKTLIEKEKEFYHRLKEYNPPPLTENDYIEIEDEEALCLGKSLKYLSQQIKELKAEEEKIRKELISKCNYHNAKVGDLKVTKYYRAGNVQYSQIPELKGVNLDTYRKPPIECWKTT